MGEGRPRRSAQPVWRAHAKARIADGAPPGVARRIRAGASITPPRALAGARSRLPADAGLGRDRDA
ncbi:MAG TPA: hypothetical protein VKV27_05760 [Solirubrobacteraceae bacterium]|nr:hypothetical protein [Solirubrobacteraceae bacterium]